MELGLGTHVTTGEFHMCLGSIVFNLVPTLFLARRSTVSIVEGGKGEASPRDKLPGYADELSFNFVRDSL